MVMASGLRRYARQNNAATAVRGGFAFYLLVNARVCLRNIRGLPLRAS